MNLTKIAVDIGWKYVNGRGDAVNYEGGNTFNGYCYKDYDAWEKGEGVCYIPEYALGYDKMVKEWNSTFTKQDFLELCDGNEKMAEYIFKVIDWQYPSSFYDEMEEGEWE